MRAKLTARQHQCLSVFVKFRYAYLKHEYRRPTISDIQYALGTKSKVGVYTGLVLPLLGKGYLARDKEAFKQRGYYLTREGYVAWKRDREKYRELEAGQPNPVERRDTRRRRLAPKVKKKKVPPNPPKAHRVPPRLLLRVEEVRNFGPGVEGLVRKIRKAVLANKKGNNKGAPPEELVRGDSEGEARFFVSRPRDFRRPKTLVEDTPGTEWWRLICPVHLWAGTGGDGEASQRQCDCGDVEDGSETGTGRRAG